MKLQDKLQLSLEGEYKMTEEEVLESVRQGLVSVIMVPENEPQTLVRYLDLVKPGEKLSTETADGYVICKLEEDKEYDPIRGTYA